jgi:XTP/dITP diphosphohydrolase
MVTLLIATRNAHKAQEIRAILGDGFSCLTLDDLPHPPEVVEDAASFAGNAIKKAVALAKWLAETPRALGGLPEGERLVLADDSGLEVDALHGAPGVHSARFAALDTGKPGNASSVENNAKLLRLLGGVPLDQRTARFRCVLALAPVVRSGAEGSSPVCYAEEAELRTETFEGACEGRIGLEARGRGGFGYDPLFLPDGYEQTFGELGEETKNQLSHRAKALAKLRHWLRRAPVNEDRA